MWRKNFSDRFSCLDTILACDRQTRCNNKDRAMQSVMRVKTANAKVIIEIKVASFLTHIPHYRVGA